MKLLKTFIQISMLFCLFFKAHSQRSDEIAYFQPSAISFDWRALTDEYEVFSAGTEEDIIRIYRNSKGLPVCYSQHIFTSVCFDNQCRPLSIIIFWNVTGRYLGYKLPEGEYLSRYDHEAFTSEDYKELNALLSDAYLPLGNIAFEELIEYEDDSLKQIDGISGATSTRILDYVVEGAAYTTYTMWNIVHGPVKEIVERKTVQLMDPVQLAQIMYSQVAQDKLWALGKIDQSKHLETSLLEPLLELICEDEYFVAYSALETISPLHLESEKLQLQLVLKYFEVQYSLRGELLKKLNTAPFISGEVIEKTRGILNDLNGEQLGYMLDLYEKHKIMDGQTARAVAALMKSENSFISKKAFKFLSQIDGLPDEIVQSIRSYAVTQK